MSCRIVKVKVDKVLYPEGGCSHGRSCCICLRRLPDSHYRVELVEPNHYVRKPKPVGLFRRTRRAFLGAKTTRVGWSFRVCSRNCVRVMAIWLDTTSTWETLAPDMQFFIPLCPAHHCHQVIEV